MLEAPGFAESQPYAQTFLDSTAIVKDFWVLSTYAELLLPTQNRVHRYVVTGEGTAQEALVSDWSEVFEDDGKR